MGHKVLKPFRYSSDGLNSKDTAVDEVIHDLPAEHVSGLTREGYIEPETASKVAGDAILSADHAGSVDSDKAVKDEGVIAAAGISDGHVGAPEAASIIDAHKLTADSDPVVIQAAQDEKAAHEAGVAGFDPKSPEALADAAETVRTDPFDHDDDSRPGGSKPKAERKKPTDKA
jgi:hypothetical protein